MQKQKKHWGFFKDSDETFGLFYPLHYTIAGFDNIDRAEKVRQAFIDDGFPEEDVAAASGPFVVEELETEEGANWFKRMQAGIAKVIGTEAGFLDDDMKLARRGGAFVFVYTPDDDDIERMHALLKRLHPIFARRYLAAGIESIQYQTQSTL